MCSSSMGVVCTCVVSQFTFVSRLCSLVISLHYGSVYCECCESTCVVSQLVDCVHRWECVLLLGVSVVSRLCSSMGVLHRWE